MTEDKRNDRDNRGGVHDGVEQKAYYYNYYSCMTINCEFRM